MWHAPSMPSKSGHRNVAAMRAKVIYAVTECVGFSKSGEESSRRRVEAAIAFARRAATSTDDIFKGQIERQASM